MEFSLGEMIDHLLYRKIVAPQKRAIRTINKANYNSHTEPLFKETSILKVTDMYAIRTINKANYNSHTEPLFKKTYLLKVTDMYEYQVVLFTHDYETHKLPISFNKMYTFNYEV